MSVVANTLFKNNKHSNDCIASLSDIQLSANNNYVYMDTYKGLIRIIMLQVNTSIGNSDLMLIRKKNVILIEMNGLC